MPNYVTEKEKEEPADKFGFTKNIYGKKLNPQTSSISYTKKNILKNNPKMIR